jgi:four helix bundle protein
MEPTRETKGQVDWERTCPHAITSDVLWKLHAYRAALYLQHLAIGDYQVLFAAHPNGDSADQLKRAAESISSNLAEGYSRSTRADRLRFFGYSLGSSRECISRYAGARDALAEAVIDERLLLLARIRALLLGLIRSYREDTSGRTRFET